MCINPYPNLFLTAVQKHLILLVWPIQNRLVNGQRDWERLALSEKRLRQYSCPFNMAEICHYESIYRHSAAGPFHLNYWFVHLFACLCASLGQIVSATFYEGVHLAVRKETREKKKFFMWYTLFRLSCSFSPNQFLFLYQNCQRSFRWSCPGANGIRVRGDSNFHADSLDCTPAVDFFDSVGLLWSHPAALISPHAPTCTYTHECSHTRSHTHRFPFM